MSREILWRVRDVVVMIDRDSEKLEIGTIAHDPRWNHHDEWEFEPIREFSWIEFHELNKSTQVPSSILKEVWGLDSL